MHPTAIKRKTVSAPMRELVDIISFSDRRVLHYGRGEAVADTRLLENMWAWVTEYDPHVPGIDYLPDDHWDYAVAIYVFNVLKPAERAAAFHDFSHSASTLIWTVRMDKINGSPYLDGMLTKRGTFQKQYTRQEALDEWPNAIVLACHPGRYITLMDSGM